MALETVMCRWLLTSGLQIRKWLVEVGIKAARHQIQTVGPWEIGHFQSTTERHKEGIA
jgi:hypothetical protein